MIVPHYRDLARLDRCLAALGAQTYPKDDFEVVVADNASPEGEAAVAAAIAGRARLVTVADKGAGLARNGGVVAARGELLAFTDADCLPDPAWLAAGTAALSGADVVGGRMQVLVDDPAAPTPVEAFEVVFAFDNEHYVKRLGFTVTANLFCSKAVFGQVGGFRIGVSEDLEWSRRATAAGLRLAYAPDALVGHPARRTWAELIAKWQRINSETYGLSAGRPVRALRWLVRSGLMPLSAVAHTPRALGSRKLATAGQRWAALGVLYRHRFWRMVDAVRVLTTSGDA
ncbi:MAG: glycosyltransferase [Phenylobacterium sp.]|nr:MAG: glycosyltransferase [Phenylobacterium sp.]